MCAYGKDQFGSNMQGMMNSEMAKRIIREAAFAGVRSFKFNFRGEPGMHKSLTETIAYAHSLRGETKIQELMLNTNMTAFSLNRIIHLAQSGLDTCIISVDGSNKETYEKIRVKADWDKLIRNYEIFKKLYPGKIIIQFVEQDANRGEAEGLKEIFNADEIRVQKVRVGKGERQQCPQPWQRLIVAWDGNVFACCGNWANEFPVGHYPEESLEEIWNGEKLEELRYFAKDPNRGAPCEKCDVGCSYKGRGFEVL